MLVANFEAPAALPQTLVPKSLTISCFVYPKSAYAEGFAPQEVPLRTIRHCFGALGYMLWGISIEGLRE